MDVSNFIFCPPISLDESIGQIVAKNVIEAIDQCFEAQEAYVESAESGVLNFVVFSDGFDRSEVEGVSSNRWSRRYSLEEILENEVSVLYPEEAQFLVDDLEALVEKLKKLKKQVHGG